jgi:uncharacterized FlgJ-related protein
MTDWSEIEQACREAIKAERDKLDKWEAQFKAVLDLLKKYITDNDSYNREINAAYTTLNALIYDIYESKRKK